MGMLSATFMRHPDDERSKIIGQHVIILLVECIVVIKE